jgi:hypothetical protein
MIDPLPAVTEMMTLPQVTQMTQKRKIDADNVRSVTCPFLLGGSTFTRTVHPSSFILHPSSFILHPSSFILHPSSFILHPSSFILHPSLAAPPALMTVMTVKMTVIIEKSAKMTVMTVMTVESI